MASGRLHRRHGDGGNATYAVAHAALADAVGAILASRHCRAANYCCSAAIWLPERQPRDYRYRFIEMFEGARRDADAGAMCAAAVHARSLAAEPRLDGLATTFSRYFIRNKDSTQFLGADIPEHNRTSASSCPRLVDPGP